MQDNQQLTQIQSNSDYLDCQQIASFIVFFFPIIGGLFYVVGSLLFWPTFTTINPATAGILFAIGSLLLVIADFIATYLEPEFSIFKPHKNVGAFRAFFSFIGNVSYTVGSVYFIPDLPIIVGEDLFIIGSILHFIPQVLSIWGTSSLNAFTEQFYIKMQSFKKTIILISILLATGCISFFVGTILFINQNIETSYLFEEGVILFIFGSLCYVVGPLLALKMRNKSHNEMNGLFL